MSKINDEAGAGLYPFQTGVKRTTFTSQPISCGPLQGRPWLATHATSCRVTFRAKQAAAARLDHALLKDLVAPSVAKLPE